MLNLLLQSLYFFLPAYFANMAPVLVKKIPLLKKPIHQRLLGPNKTWRGLLFGTLVGGLVFLLQHYAFNQGFHHFALIDYAGFPVWFGFLQGFGALLGDLIKSFYKRKQKIAPGEPWFPYDQLDFVFGGIILGGLVYFPPAKVVGTLLVVSPVLHVLVNLIGYILKIKESKF